MFTTVKTDTTAGTKDTELVVSTGNDNAQSDGHSSGTLRTSPSPAAGEGLGEGAFLDLSVGGHGEGDSGQTTTRVITSVAPGTSSRTTVTRTDTGEGKTNTGGAVKSEDGQTERTGTFDGNSDSGATVVYAHLANNKPARTFEAAGGTLTTKVNTNFDGTSNSTNTDNSSTLDATVKRDDTEDSVYLTGWFDWGTATDPDTSEEYEYFAGQITTFSVDAKDDTKAKVELSPSPSAGEGLGEGATDLKITLEGGSSGGTEKATVNRWDYREYDDSSSKFDYAWSSSTTTRSGKDKEGNPSLSESTIEQWISDDLWQLDDYEDNGDYGWESHQETDRTYHAGQIVQTASITGPEDKRRHTLAIDSYFESLVEQTESDTVYDTDPNDPGDWSILHEENNYRDEKLDRSNYHSSHLADENGLARDGEFSSSSVHVETRSVPKPLSSSYYYYESHHDDIGGEYYDLDEIETEQLSRVTKTTSETGSYYDVSLLFGLAVRIQNGEYTITETARLAEVSDDYTEHEDYAYGFESEDLLIVSRDTSRITTTGSYGPGGIRESREYETTELDVNHFVDTEDDLAGDWEVTTIFQTTYIQNDNGDFSGHLYHSYTTVDPTGTYETIIADDDLFPNQTAPEGVKPQGTQGGYTPGTIEATITQIAATNLLPGGQFLNSLARLLSPALIVAAVGQTTEGTVPTAEEEQGWLDWFTDLIPFLGSGKDIAEGASAFDGQVEANRGAREARLAEIMNSNRRTNLDVRRPLAAGNTLGKVTPAVEGFATLNYEFMATAPTTATPSGGGANSSRHALPQTGQVTQVHHIASNKGGWKTTFEALFGRVGLGLDDAVNKMDLPGHAGRHIDEYHQLVFNRLYNAIAGKRGEEAKNALINALNQLRRELEANPRLPYSDGGLR